MAVRLKPIFWTLLMLRDLFVQTECPYYCHVISYPVWCRFPFNSIWSWKYNRFSICFVFMGFRVTCDKVTRTSWGRCDLWSLSLILPYFRFSFILFYHCPRGLVELEFPALSSTCPHPAVITVTLIQQHRPPGRHPRLPCCFSPTCVNRWMLWLLTPLLLFLLLFTLLLFVVLPINSS